MQKLAIFDIDGTLFHWQLYHELVFKLKDLGYFSKEDSHELDSALMSWQSKKTHWFDYEMKVIYAFEKYLSQIEPEKLREVAKIIVEHSGHRIYRYTFNLLQKFQKEGYFTLAISASQQVVAEAFARKYGFDDCIGAEYATENNHYTGEKIRVVHGRKDKIIHEFLQSHPELTLAGSVAVGDSGGDISMLELVDQPVAFNPSEELLDVALKKGWKVVIERKNIAYSLQNHGDQTILNQTDAL